jgi:hypothetical protein
MAILEPGRRAFVVTYGPLCATPFGREAIARFGFPPFIDGSIRREPDLQHPVPSISCLCRAGKFAPRLSVGDHVLYLTQKGQYGEATDRHWRLVALLRVKVVFESHEVAAAEYLAWGHKLPSNCMVEGNGPMALEQSHRKVSVRGCSSVLERWDQEYRKRSEKHGVFVACDPVLRYLGWDAPVVTDHHLEHAFGRVPGTQNPGERLVEELQGLLELLGIRVRVSA